MLPLCGQSIACCSVKSECNYVRVGNLDGVSMYSVLLIICEANFIYWNKKFLVVERSVKKDPKPSLMHHQNLPEFPSCGAQRVEKKRVNELC